MRKYKYFDSFLDSFFKCVHYLKMKMITVCPPSVVARDPEHGKRNRLPLDIKQKLTKVARLAVWIMLLINV